MHFRFHSSAKPLFTFRIIFFWCIVLFWLYGSTLLFIWKLFVIVYEIIHFIVNFRPIENWSWSLKWTRLSAMWTNIDMFPNGLDLLALINSVGRFDYSEEKNGGSRSGRMSFPILWTGRIAYIYNISQRETFESLLENEILWIAHRSKYLKNMCGAISVALRCRACIIKPNCIKRSPASWAWICWNDRCWFKECFWKSIQVVNRWRWSFVGFTSDRLPLSLGTLAVTIVANCAITMSNNNAIVAM